MGSLEIGAVDLCLIGLVVVLLGTVEVASEVGAGTDWRVRSRLFFLGGLQQMFFGGESGCGDGVLVFEAVVG